MPPSRLPPSPVFNVCPVGASDFEQTPVTGRVHEGLQHPQSRSEVALSYVLVSKVIVILLAREIAFGVDSREVPIGGLGRSEGMTTLPAAQKSAKDWLIG